MSERITPEEPSGPRHAYSAARRGITGPASVALRAAPVEEVKHANSWTILGTLVPGLGMLKAGRPGWGWTVLGAWLAGLASMIFMIFQRRRALTGFLLDPAVLNTLAWLLPIIAVAWVVVIGATYLMLRPAQATRGQRLAGSAVVGALSFLVAGPLAVASAYARSSADLVSTVFQSGNDSKSATRPKTTKTANDPWADQKRVNILLLGGDSGTKRDIRLGVRTDTVILASIDTQTGDTVLVSLPRGTARMPFPKNSPLHKKFPNGFTNGNPDDGNWMLNAMYLEVPNLVDKNIIGPTDNLGADALKLSVGEALGQKVDYFVLIDLDGFKALIDALGGVRINVNYRIPMGGVTDKGIPPKKWLEPGKSKKLNGYEAMWYARGRYGIASGDYDRMDRQRCVIKAVIDQADPTTMLTRFEAISKASKTMVLTDIPREELGSFVDLSLRVKDGNVRSVVFRHQEDGFLVYNPDFAMMRKRVAKAIKEAGQTKAAPATSASSSAQPSGSSTTTTPKSTKTNKTTSEDVADSCAYNPKK